MASVQNPCRILGADLTTLAKCERIIENISAVVPFDNILVSGLDADGMRVGTGTILISNFPVAYLNTYYLESYPKIDPIVALTLSAQRTVTDEEAWRDRKQDAKSQRLQDLLLRYGIRHRTVVPVARSGRAYGSVVVTSQRPLKESEREYLEFSAEPLHQISSQPFEDEVRARLGLTAGEIQCLALASLGLTSDEIGGRSAYTVETVNSYLKAATKKLGAANRTQAVAEAVRRKLIS